MILTCAWCGKQFRSERSKKYYCGYECSNRAKGAKMKTKNEAEPVTSVWNCGGGVDSAGIAALIALGEIEKPDIGIMVDTGYESGRTLAYVKNVIVPAMGKAGVKFEIVKSTDFADVELFHKGICTLPAYRQNEDGSVSHFNTYCNGVWKDLVVKRYLRKQGIKRAENWIGIAADEAHRAQRTNRVKWLTKRYPLIEKGVTRKGCIEKIKAAGWEVPIHSSCIMCPQRTRFEWLRMSIDNPKDYNKAREIEENIRRTDARIWLTPTCELLDDYISRG